MRRALAGLLCVVGLAACVHEEEDTPSPYDTRKQGRVLVLSTSDPAGVVAAVAHAANAADCSSGTSQGTLIVDCRDEAHLQLTPKEGFVEVACWATRLSKCRSMLVRLGAPSPGAKPDAAAD